MGAQKFFILLSFCALIVACNNHSSTSQKYSEIASDTILEQPSDSIVQRVAVKMIERNGVYELPCIVNGVKMNFIFDTGASNVSISLTEAMFLYKNDYLKDSDILGSNYSQIADGRIVENMDINLKSVVIGGLELNDIRASVVSSASAPLLLGQSALRELGRVEIANDSLFITSKVKMVKPEDLSVSTCQDEKAKTIKSPRQSFWNKIRELFLKSKNDKVDALLAKAIAALDNDMPELFEAYCNEAKSIDNDSWKTYAVLGEYYYNGKGLDSTEGFAPARIRSDDSRKFREACDNLNKYKELNTSREVLTIGNHTYKWEILVSHLVSYTRDISTAQEVLKTYPDNSLAMYALSRAYQSEGKYDLAEKWAKKTLDYDEADGYYALAVLYDRQRGVSEAVKYYKKVIEINTKHCERAMYNLAKIYLDYNEYDYRYQAEAIELMRESAKKGFFQSMLWLQRNNIGW